ncbi:MAG: hypothetical protein LM590_08265 [Thermofilum sp.]|nr:hypothetical protein [Thermofilum sp.]
MAISMSTARIRACVQYVSAGIDSGKLPRAFKGFEEEVCEGAVRARDIEVFGDYSRWVEWLGWASVVLDEDDYLKAAVYGLSLAPKLAGADYGTARQRDLGQLWTDVIRGFLGEIAVAEWLKERFGITAELDYRLGPLEEFLPSDIKSVAGREPRLRVSIKTTKLSGLWLDVPGAQIEHSDVFILVRVGVTREHFVAFLKKISVIRDKLMREAVERGLVKREEIEQIWDSIPEFTAAPAYIAGFLDKTEIQDKLRDRTAVIEADVDVKIKKVVINKFLGFWHPGEDIYEKKLKELLRRRGRPVRDEMSIEFEGIGDFSKTLHFIASSGALKKKKEDWEKLVERL